MENKDRTMLFYNGIGLSLCVIEQIKLARIRLKKAFGIINTIPKIQLSCSGAREGP